MQIYLPDKGVYRTPEELALEPQIVGLALNPETWQLEPVEVVDVRPLGLLPAYVVETRLGRRLRAPARAQLLTIAGWRSLGALQPGAWIAVPRRLPGPAEATLAKKDLELAAWLLADCWSIEEGALKYALADAQQADELAALARRVFGRASRCAAEQSEQGWQVSLALSQPLVDWLAAMGYLADQERRVPQPVLAQPLRGVNQFLRQLWAVAGTISVQRGHAPQVCCCVPGAPAARDVQSLLLRLEINAVVLPAESDQGSGRTESYLVHISGKRDLKRFCKLLGLRLSERRERAVLAINEYLAGHTGISGRDLLPRETWELLVLPAMRAASVSEWQIQAALGYPPFALSYGVPQLTRERAAQVAWLTRSEELARLAKSELYWDEIVSCVAAGALESYVLVGSQNLVADNLLVAGL